MLSLRKLLTAVGGKDSLSRSINQLEDLESRFSEALASYKAAMDSVAEHAPAASKTMLEDYRKQLRRLRATLGSDPTRAVLLDVRKELDGTLKLYGRAIDQHTRRHEDEAKQVMAIVAVMAESIAGHEKQYNVRFRGIAKKLRLLATSQDLSEIRQKLSDEVSQLEKYADDMSHDTQSALARVQADLSVARQQPRTTAADPWADLAVDPVTGLAARGQGMAAIEAQMRAHVRFCLARFVILGFERIVHNSGRQGANEMLQAFAGRLRSQFQEQDLLFRWDDGEFLAITGSGLPELAGRITEIERSLSGLYDPKAGRGDGIAASCVGGVIESFHGEMADDMLARLRNTMSVGQSPGW